MLVPLANWARREIEEKADELLTADRRNYEAGHSTHYFGILSEDQLRLRSEREILTKTGRFEMSNPGCYHRAHNPLLNSRPSKQRQFSMIADPWRQLSWESLGAGDVNIKAWFPIARREDVVSGWHPDIWFARDPAWPIVSIQGFYHHLTRGQRSQIRAVMRAIPTNKPLARDAVRMSLSRHYGVPTWVIVRVCS